MRYFSIFLWLYLAVSIPVFAYRSGNTSIIGVKQKQSLLDRNYIFDNLNLSQKSRIQTRTKANLNSLSQLQNKSIRPKATVSKRNTPSLDFENSWNSFQAVNDEELSVKAKIIGRAE
ncbi:MAG: hypothetical protein HRT47_05855 [Candidatus Caenarcaniphilales bacterium]|nr:hypothetical protein [Candidatus Caenarcaniphilales bacterium]